MGVQASLYAAAAGNVTAALVALILAKTTVAPPVPVNTAEPASEGAPYRRFALAAAAAAGAVGLAYEVAWTRLLAIYTLNSVYVFTMVVTVYLAALAIGAGVVTRLMRSARTEPLRLLMCVQVALAFLGPILLALVPAAARLDLTQPGRSETDIFVREYLLAGAIVFLPTLLIGMTLPLLVAMLSSPLERAGRTVGTIYAWNSVGTIVGSAVTGVALIPLIGLRGTLLLLAGCNFAIASAAALLRPAAADWSRAVPTLGAAAFVFLVALVPPVAQFYRPVTGVQEQLLYYAEGPSATVHVSEISGAGPTHRRLFVDSESVAGTYPEIVTDQKMLAHVPLLLHPAPRRALTVGFGTGGTSYSMLLHGVRVDCVEIEPRVPEAYELFASENKGMVGPGPQRGGFRLVLDDARAWLHVTPEPYDVIVTDVTSIQYRGNGNLFTTDYFHLMRDDLTDDGLGCAWAPLTGVTPAQLKILIGSFREVFPHTSVWYMLNLPTDFVILVGTPGPLAVDLESMGRRMQRPLVQRDLATMGFDSPFQLLACLLLAEDDVAAYVGHAPLHTDDRPILDYLTHATAYRRTLVENLGEMLLYRTDAAQYVSAWPAGVAPAATGPTGRTAPALWSRWNQAAAHLIAGHIAAVGTTDDAANLARQAYESAAALLPDDPIIKGLLRP